MTETFFVSNVYASQILYPPGGKYGPRIQRWLQLVMIHAGSMTLYVDSVPHEAGRDTITLLMPGHHLYFEFARDTETRHSWVDGRFVEPSVELMAHLKQLPRTIPLSPLMNEMTRKVVGLNLDRQPLSKLLMQSLVAQMFWQFAVEAEHYTGVSADKPAHPAVERAQHFIQHYLTERLTLRQIAGAAAVSPAHLIRLFRAELSTTPMDYVWMRRVETGIELLRQTGLKVDVIAERCGFQTYNHFSRRVRLTTGLSPAEIRRLALDRRE